MEQNSNEGSIESNSSAESYSTGTAGGYKTVKPFNLKFLESGDDDTISYIGNDGYLYTGGSGWGTASNNSGASKTPMSQQTSLGQNTVVDHVLSNSYGYALLADGTLMRATSGTGSRTWSTVYVGTAYSSSSNKVVAVDHYHNNYAAALLSTGAIYSGSAGSSLNTAWVSTSEASTNQGVKDFSIGNVYKFVLFNNGNLYRQAIASSGIGTHVASNIKMFDCDFDTASSNYIFTYDGTTIKVGAEGSVSTTASSWTNLLSITNVVQIRGTYGGWGYLTSGGILYGNQTSGTGTASQIATGVSYFDNSYHTWGYLSGGAMYFWEASGRASSITTVNTPTIASSALSTNGSTGSSGITTPDLGGIPEITAPAFIFGLHKPFFYFKYKKCKMNVIRK